MATIKEINDRAESLTAITNSVPVKNRIVDGRVKITYDGASVVWEAGEVKVLPRKVADWLQAKSLFLFNPGDIDNDIPAKSHYKLAILGIGQDEGELTQAQVAGVHELLDRSNMPELTRIDPATGKPLRVAYIDPRATGASSIAIDRRERAATRMVSSAIVTDAADKIADAAQGASEQDIEQAVAGLTGVES